jgi:putative endonuclease
MTNLVKGKRGEDIAVSYLKARGYEILARNWHCRFGELDITALDKNNFGELAFIEVKYRSNSAFGEPYEAVTWFKYQKLLKTVQQFLDSHLCRRLRWRLDIISINVASNKFGHYKNVVNF